MVVAKEEAICSAFGLFMWWNPKDSAVTWENAAAIFDPPLPVRTDGPRDSEGWLAFKVNLNEPLGEIVENFRRLVRLHQSFLKRPNTRSRPDIRVKEVQIFSHWNKTRSLPKVAAELGIDIRTARRHFSNACLSIRGNFPSQKKKARLANGFTDFPTHVAECSRCEKGSSSGDPNDFCKIALAAFDQDAIWGPTSARAKRDEREGVKKRNGKVIS
jgi:hypothetical protein